MYDFWYDYINQSMYMDYMDTDSSEINIKSEDRFEDIAKDAEQRFDTSDYKIESPLPIGKNKTVIGLVMKDELGEKTITDFARPRPKTFS